MGGFGKDSRTLFHLVVSGRSQRMRPVSDKCRSGSPLPAAAFPAESKDGPPFAHFQRRLHLVLPEVVLEPQEVFHRVLVIGVVGDPFATLGGGIYRIQTKRDL